MEVLKNVFLALQFIVAVGLIIVVLLQRSEGGALGIGGGSNSLISGRGAADVLARSTTVMGGVFLFTSLILTLLAANLSAPAPIAGTDAPREQNRPAGINLEDAPRAAPVEPAEVGPVETQSEADPIVAPSPEGAGVVAAPVEPPPVAPKPAPVKPEPAAAVVEKPPAAKPPAAQQSKPAPAKPPAAAAKPAAEKPAPAKPAPAKPEPAKVEAPKPEPAKPPPPKPPERKPAGPDL